MTQRKRENFFKPSYIDLLVVDGGEEPFSKLFHSGKIQLEIKINCLKIFYGWTNNLRYSGNRELKTDNQY